VAHDNSSIKINMIKEYRWHDAERDMNRSTRIKTGLSATVSTTNRTLTDLGSRPGLRVQKMTTNRLSHKSLQFVYIICMFSVIAVLTA
jgi:hypothetical protein